MVMVTSRSHLSLLCYVLEYASTSRSCATVPTHSFPLPDSHRYSVSLIESPPSAIDDAFASRTAQPAVTMATTAARAAATAAAEFELAGETACGAYCPLAHPSDPSMLSPHLCHIRMHIELFAASPQDVERRRRQGGSKIVLGLGQVGIRCRWCKDLAGVPPRTKKARGATLFPNHLSNVHQAVRNFQRHHFLCCELIPSEVISVFENLRTGRCGGGKETQSRKQSSEYWVNCCMEMGLVDKMGGGVYFQKRGVPIRGRSPLVSGANATVGPRPVAGGRKRPHKHISASPGAPEGATVARSAQWTRRVRQPRRTTAAPPTPLAEKVQAIGGPAGGPLPPPQQCQPQDADSSARNGAIPVTPHGPLGSPRELERIDPRTTPRIGWMGGEGPFFSGGAGTGLGVPTAFGGVGSHTKTGAFATGYNNSKSALETIIHNFFFDPGTIDAPASVEEMQLREMKLTIIRSISSDECAAMVRAFVVCKEDNLPAEFGDERLRMFLRREQFDPVNAALRFARYWQKRRELFGANKFALSMTPAAALRDDHKALLVGFIVILPGTDSKGRTLLLKGGNNKRGGDYEVRSLCLCILVHALHLFLPRRSRTHPNCLLAICCASLPISIL